MVSKANNSIRTKVNFCFSKNKNIAHNAFHLSKFRCILNGIIIKFKLKDKQLEGIWRAQAIYNSMLKVFCLCIFDFVALRLLFSSFFGAISSITLRNSKQWKKQRIYEIYLFVFRKNFPFVCTWFILVTNFIKCSPIFSIFVCFSFRFLWAWAHQII